MARIDPTQSERLQTLIAKKVGVSEDKVTQEGFTAEWGDSAKVRITWRGYTEMTYEEFNEILSQIAYERSAL